MKISLIKDPDAAIYPIISAESDVWYRINEVLSDRLFTGTVEIMAYEKMNPGILSETIFSKKNSLHQVDLSEAEYVIPFKPLSYRDFMLYEKHYINSARGFLKKYLPHFLPFIVLYEKFTGNPFPKLKPKKRWYTYPIYYLGNHLTFVTNGVAINIPSYTKELDYELELGAVLSHPLKNATPEEAEKAIGGFVVFNDFSARDVQMDEMSSGFGPMKAKNFANSISSVVVTADDVLPTLDQLQVSVTINGETIIESDMSGMDYSFPEAIAYASWEEQLYPGEFFGSGTVPGCSGIENGRFLKGGDIIRLEIEGVGVLENNVI